MANLILPDPRMEMPELLEPGRKPIGPVSIDRDHWAGKYCRYAFIPVNTFADVIHGPLSIKNGTPSVSAGVATFDADVVEYDSPFPVYSAITILIKLRRTNVAHHMGIFSDKNKTEWGSDVGVSLNLRAESSGALFKIGTSETVTTDTSVPIGDWFTLAAVSQPGEFNKIYINGTAATVNANQSWSDYSQASTNVRIGTYFDEATNFCFDGDIEYIYLFESGFSADKIQALHRSPYQFLIPA